LKAYW